jgi:hypothetical protein
MSFIEGFVPVSFTERDHSMFSSSPTLVRTTIILPELSIGTRKPPYFGVKLSTGCAKAISEMVIVAGKLSIDGLDERVETSRMHLDLPGVRIVSHIFAKCLTDNK